MTRASQIANCFAAVVLVANFSLLEADRLRLARTKSATFSDYGAFLQAYDNHAREKTSSVSHSLRRQLFETRKSEVEAHNAQNKSWKKAINLFSDFTAEELQSRLGYKRAGGRWEQTPSSFLEKQDSDILQIDISKLAATVDWRNNLNSSNFVHNQGGCGSCWAHAAVGALEAAAEIHAGFQGNLSTDQIIQCTANPRHCGGTGGCQGATSEMAFERAARYGIIKMEEFEGLKDGHCLQQTHPAVKVSSFVRLPENSASHLLHAVATYGPVVVSVDAGPIFSYGSGVFSGCEQDALVNHAVTAVGYGRDANKDYWLIKNSWGPSWGESGYFRVERHSDGEFCGIDRKPQEGVYCDNAPAEIKVCGMCGIYSDSSYPIIAGASNLAKASNLAPAKSHAF